MRKLRRQVPVALALIVASLSSSCSLFLRPRSILRHGKPATQAQTLLVATRDELNARIGRMYGAINSFQATVDMTPSVGSVYKGQITEIKDVRAFVLFRKPDDIHIIGYTPVIRTKAFDMVSNGSDFRLYVSESNLFVQGANDAPATSKNKIENLRPDAFLSSMLVRPADPAIEVPILSDQTDEDNALYILYFLRKGPGGEILPFFTRSVWFDRLDLSIVRQMVFDTDANIVSDTRYAKWQPYDGVLFPAHIDINRWKDGYGVVMDLEQIQMNKALTNDQFALAQPEGTKLQNIGDQKRENH
jgi:hypothetical protein